MRMCTIFVSDVYIGSLNGLDIKTVQAIVAERKRLINCLINTFYMNAVIINIAVNVEISIKFNHQ